MSDLGKLLVFLQGRPAMILLISVVIVAFIPFESLAEFKQEYGVWVTLAGVIAGSSVFVNLLFVLKDGGVMQMIRNWKEEKRKKKEFELLSPAQQLLVLNLYFGGMAGSYVDDDLEPVKELINDGFVTWGCITVGEGVLLELTSPAQDFIKKNKDQMKCLRKNLINQGIHSQVFDWIVLQR
ncbi:MAG: hypothetical protein Q4E62_02895 [Sutterellaceae bacterium]|nr:hypothetical protein [Sutterellaceae bacterium]